MAIKENAGGKPGSVDDNAVDPIQLGATMYVPVIHPAVSEIVSGTRYVGLKSVVLCLEDALAVKDVSKGLNLLKSFLSVQRPDRKVLTFVRPRSLDMAREISRYEGVNQIDGFVVPKITLDNLEGWLEIADETSLQLMATLESEWVFDPSGIEAFIAKLDELNTDRLIALRVGGNDLLSCLGLRCVRGRTVYEGPLSLLLSQLMCRFGSKGYALTAPVYDQIDDIQTLRRECRQDVDFGFVGKTAIHPSQIHVIQSCFAVSRDEFGAATEILKLGASAVFKHDGAMSEPATHTEWARRILRRHHAHGFNDEYDSADEDHEITDTNVWLGGRASSQRRVQSELRHAASSIYDDPWVRPATELVFELARAVFGEDNTIHKMSKTLHVNRTTAYRWVSKSGNNLSPIPWSSWCIMLMLSGNLDLDDFVVD